MSKSLFAALYRMLSGLLALCLLSTDLAGAVAFVDLQSSEPIGLPVAVSPAEQQALFRTTVTLRQPTDLSRLREMGVVVLESDEASALLLVTAVQLENLARLRFAPAGTDELGALAQGNAPTYAWLADSLRPNLVQAAGIMQARATLESSLTVEDAIVLQATAPALQESAAALTSVLAGLSAEQVAALGDAISTDFDGDGLTDTEEAWWCTDPANQDTDADGRLDGGEILALRDWVNNRRSRPPFETPWPNWPPQRVNCPDKDFDSIPNSAERWDLGSSMDLESTDRDRYDDGQEVYGTTYCPGSANACGYGSLPSANHDGIVLFQQLPSWVTAPGNHPLVAALPKLEFEIVADAGGNNFRIQTATVLTIDNRRIENETKHYSTTKTEGTSTSDTETETWENWQEYSKTTELVAGATDPQFGNIELGNALSGSVNFSQEVSSVTNVATNQVNQSAQQINNITQLAKQGGPQAYLGAKAAESADFVLSEACAEVNCKKYVGSAARATVRTILDYPNIIYQSTTPNKCAQDFLSRLKCTAKATATQWKNTFDARVAQVEEQEARDQASGAELEAAGGYLNTTSIVPVTFPVPQFTPTQTETSGSSRGGARSTTHARYEEHSVTEGTSRQFGQEWGTATAENSAHAADLWFAYQLRNVGTDYARQICNIAINVYIGDDEIPAATYYPANDIGGNGCLANYRPDEAHRYTFSSGSRIALTLEQLKTIDLGGAVHFVIEDFSLGQDDYYTDDAFGGGLSVLLNDGPEDGDDTTESYLIPTWEGDTVLDVVARYLPNEIDENGTLVALWTPEYRADTPGWCKEPLEVGTGSARTLWCKHALSTADWWNVYTADLGTGAENYENTPASPGGVVLFRFNLDSDGDGYSDRTEDYLGTNPVDLSSVPHPQLIAGLHNIRNGNTVETTLSLLNTGLDDAFGVEAVMVAPDDSLQITKNTVGGAGRVRAGRSVVVGSRLALQSPLPSVWNQPNHAIPLVGGYFVGTSNKTYTFTVNCTNPGGCQVGSGSWDLAWNSGSGSGSLAVGGGYSSPTLLDVGNEGLKLALLSGTAKNGETFTVSGLVPRDTFQYTIARQDYSPPLVLVRYNDMTGPHHFMLAPDAPALDSPDASLVGYSAYMLEDPRLEIVASGVYQTGQNNTNVLINNPGTVTITNSHVFLEFINEAGVVVAEERQDIDSPSGPSVLTIPWSTGAFSPAYDPDEAYLAMAIWTDYEGNIIASVARPLLTFQDDPTAILAFDDADLTWNFGTAAQGTLLQRRIVLGSTGYQSLLTHIGGATGVSVAAPAESTLGPADMGIYTLQINTADLAVGPFSTTIPIRTSDAANAEKTLTITGTVTPFVADDSEMVTVRPLDWLATIPGTHSIGEWVTYSHTLGPMADTLHPVRVYSEDYTTLWGVGDYATDFSAGTAPGDLFGDGSDGDLVISGNVTDSPIDSSASGIAGTITLNAYNPSFVDGQVILIHQSRGTGVGAWELNKIASYIPGSITTVSPLKATYVDSGASQAQVRVVPQYRDVLITSGSTWSAKFWNGDVGGILAFLSSGTTVIDGVIEASRRGFSQGTVEGGQGEGTAGPRNTVSCIENGNGGGGGQRGSDSLGGGGGGNGSMGQGGHSRASHCGGYGGYINPDQTLSAMYFGGGGGAGAGSNGWTTGGDGGGIVVAIAREVAVTGTVFSKGQDGAGGDGNDGTGGGGAGGSLLFRVRNAGFGDNKVLATGGTGGPGYFRWGGYGGEGIVRVEYCDQPPTGTTVPGASLARISCFVAEQIEAAPYTQGRLNLPESFLDGRNYAIQYGRRHVFLAADDHPTSLRVPAGFISEATLSALISGVGSGDVTFKLDIGDDGTWDWQTTQAVTNAAELLSPTLSQAFNTYWSSHGALTTGTLDVPVRVYLSKAGQVMLTDFEVTYTSAGQANAAALDNILTASAEMGLVTEVSTASSTGIQRPLDWLATISGAHNKGEWYTYSHTLGPDAVSLYPVKVYDEGYQTLWGLGKYASSPLPGNSTDLNFGTGASGDVTISGLSNGDYQAAPMTTSVSAGQRQVAVGYANYFVPGTEVLIIQMQGAGAGNYEFGTVHSTNADGTTLTLNDNLVRTYAAGGVNRAQVVNVPHYRNLTVQAGGTYAPPRWNGITGGVLAFRASGTVSIAQGGKIDASFSGFRGGSIGPQKDTIGYQGENETGTQYRMESANGVGGGSGDYRDAGGGGGHANYGGRGYLNGDLGQAQEGGYGGNPVGTPELTTMLMGGGGGAGNYHPNNPSCSYGHPGAGILIIAAENLNVSGEIDANGEDAIPYYYCRSGGAGAGGSILIRVATASLGNNLIEAKGGISIDTPGGPDAQGGDGSVGRIRIEYCQTVPTGNTNPAASVAIKACQRVEQVESAPHNQGRLNLPESFTDGRTYAIQYGRRFVHAAASEQTSTLRVPAGAFSNVTLHSLVSGVGSGNVTFKLDVGNDGTWDWEATQDVTNAVDLGSSDLSGAFNTYWSTHGAPSSGTLNVPVRVYLSKAGQVLLTDLQMTGGNSRLRFVRLPAEGYAGVFLNLAIGQGGAGNVTVAADVGDNGSVDWTWTGAYPSTVTTDDLGEEFTEFLLGKSGDVDVPVRFFLPAAVAFNLTGATVAPANKADATLSTADIAFSAANPVEGEPVDVTATLRNTGNHASDGVTAAFFATLPGSTQEWYIGSTFVPNIPAGGTADATLAWDTLGFNGATTVRVEIDPYDRLVEGNDNNNQATKQLTVRRRPDLQVVSIALSDPEPVAGQAIDINVTVSNAGQAQSAAATCALYLGNPDDGGTLLGQQPCGPINGGGQQVVAYNWPPAAKGAVRLFVRLDTADVVKESDEGNNDDWYDTYVGFAGSIQIDSGTAGDATYTAAAGYGAIDDGVADDLFTATCPGNQTDEERTMRGDPDGSVTYRFDHLLPAATSSTPGHFYHLDLMLLECDGEGRQQTVYVDDIAFRGPYDLVNGQVQRLSLLLDPAFYADHTITVKIKTPVGTPGGALVSSIRLYNIDYRYADSGGTRDVAYPGGPAGFTYGWLNDDGNITTLTTPPFGPLPNQTARRDGNDNDLDYQFDGLDSAKLYRINVTLFNGAANTYVESVLINSLPTAIAGVSLSDMQPHSASADVPPAAYNGNGSINVKIRRDNGTVTLVSEIALEEVTQAIAPTCSPPTISGFTPTSGQVGATVTIDGTNLTGATSVTFNSTAATTFTVVSATQMTAVVPTGATTGKIAVTTPCSTVTSAADFTVTTPPPVPTITGFTPASGQVGTMVIINGTNLTGATGVTFNGTAAATFTVVSATQMTAVVPTGATTGRIAVTTPGGTATSATDFAVTTPPPVPTITGFTPTLGLVGTTVTINGTNLIGATSVTFNGTAAATFNVVSATQMTAVVPAGATTGKIAVTTPGGTATSTADFTVTTPPPVPTITGFTPTSGLVGTTVTINGTNLTGATGVTFNGAASTTFNVVSAIQIIGVVPTGATTGKIAVTTPGGTATSATDFTVTTPPPVPTITGFTPTSGLVGTTVTINGANLTGATSVTFNGTTAATFNVVSAIQMTAVVPAGATTGKIAATTLGGTATSTADFTVTTPPPVPTLTSFTPTSGSVGTTVTINGANLTGATSVTFNGTAAATFNVVSATQMTAGVPIGATTGRITVTTPGGTATSSADFTVTAAPIFPDVFYISPSTNVTLGAIAAQGADVLRYTKSTNAWTMFFDGSDHGLTKNISAFSVTDDGSLLFVVAANQAISGLGTATPFDVVRFTPNDPNAPTLSAGMFSMFFQGQLKGLTASGEKIDAFDLSGNRLLLSTGGAASVPKPGGGVLKAADEDVFVFNLGTNAFESALLIDGSKMPKMGAEDISGLWDDPQSGDYYITILGAFSLGSVKGNDKNIVKLTPNGGASVYTPSLVTWLAAGATLPSTFKIDGIELVR